MNERREVLRVVDERTGLGAELPIENGAVDAAGLASLRAGAGDPGLAVLDFGLAHTAACRSRITSLDPTRGRLTFRGHPVDQLAARGSFLDVVFLLWNGELPGADDAADLERQLAVHAFVHEDVKRLVRAFRYDAQPMALLASTVAALGAMYPEARRVHEREVRRLQMVRLLAKLPTLAALAYRHALGVPAVEPDPSLAPAARFLAMAKRLGEREHVPEPSAARALEEAWIVLADHEQACSTHVVRAVASAQGDPYAAVAAGCAALEGPLHGGAGEAVFGMWREIGRAERVPAFVAEVRDGRGERRLFGFGHRAYQAPDPRAPLLRRVAVQTLAANGATAIAEVALTLEAAVSADDRLRARGLEPSADYWTALLWHVLGFPPETFPLLFALPRAAGWLAHWEEAILDEDGRLLRPRQVYEGPPERDVP
jgi:citrate synthase